MSEIDFDELDRAVTSAISNNNSTSSDGSANYSQTRLSVSPRPLDNQSDKNTEATRSELSMPTIPSRPVVERPNTGRFLDMVHPSANMKNSTQSTPFRSTETPATSRTQNTFSDNNLKNNAMPFMPQSSNQPVQKIESLAQVDSSDNTLLDISKISAEMNKSLSSNLGENADSPFLADAKVEKRPLNALASDDQQTAFPSVQSPGSMAQEKNIDTPLPAELESNLLSIESNIATKNTDEIIIENENDEQALVDVENSTEFNQEAQKPITLEVKPEQPEASPVQQTQASVLDANKISVNSIAQQYQEKPSSTQQANGAIYDVKDYHKVASVVKKKLGWGWVFWTIFLIVASVGAGVAVYFFVLPEM